MLKNGYWHARSPEYLNQSFVRVIEWLRLPGDTVFIDGFSLTNPKGRGVAAWSGLFVIENCRFVSTTGRNVHFSYVGTSGTIRYSTFIRSAGGGLEAILIDLSPTLVVHHCVFYDLIIGQGKFFDLCTGNRR